MSPDRLTATFSEGFSSAAILGFTLTRCVFTGARRRRHSGNPFCISAPVTSMDGRSGLTDSWRRINQSPNSWTVWSGAWWDTVSCLQPTNTHQQLITDCRLWASQTCYTLTQGLPTLYTRCLHTSSSPAQSTQQRRARNLDWWSTQPNKSSQHHLLHSLTLFLPCAFTVKGLVGF